MGTEAYQLPPGLSYFLVRENGKLWWIELQAGSAFEAREMAVRFFAIHERYPSPQDLEVFLCDRPVTRINRYDPPATGKPSLSLVKSEPPRPKE